MSYFVNPVEEDRCVFLSYEGELPPLEVSAARYEAHGVLNRRHWKRIVVDVTALRSLPTPAQLLDFASGLTSDVPPETRVALVVLPEQEAQAQVVEKVARRRGISLNAFRDPESAIDWVKTSPAPQNFHPHKRERIAIGDSPVRAKSLH